MNPAGARDNLGVFQEQVANIGLERTEVVDVIGRCNAVAKCDGRSRNGRGG